ARLQIVLDVRRRHLLDAGSDEDVLLSIGDRDEAVGVDLRDVARAEPAVVVQHLARGGLLLVVAGEDRRAPDHELAGLGETELRAGERGPNRPEPVAPDAVDGRRRRAL